MADSHISRGRVAATAFLAALALSATASAEAATLLVSQGAVPCDAPTEPGDTSVPPDALVTYLTITGAINRAQSGDEVVVCPGVYPESVTIAKSVKLRSFAGAASTIIAPPLAYSGIAIMAPDVTVGRDPQGNSAGFTVKAGVSAWAPSSTSVDASTAGLYIAGKSFNLVTGAVVQEPATGAVVQGNVIAGFTEVGISIGVAADDAQVVDNKVLLAAMSAGIDLGADAPSARTVGIAVNAAGPEPITNRLTPTNGAKIENNEVIAESVTGVIPQGTAIAVCAPTSGVGAGPRIAGNHVEGGFAKGIALSLHRDGSAGSQSMSRTEITGNTVIGVGSTSGVSLAADPGLQITETKIELNKVQGASVGIQLANGATDSTVTDNALSVNSAAATPPDPGPLDGQPVDPSANVIDIEDSTSGVYAFDTRNLIYDNSCLAAAEPAKAANAARSAPAGLCALSEPPEPVLHIDGGAVEGIAETVHVTFPSGTASTTERFKEGGDGHELSDYEDWTTTHTHAVKVIPSSGRDLVVHVQAKATQEPASISSPVTLREPVAANALPVPEALTATFGRDGTATVHLQATQPPDEASEAITFKMAGSGLSLLGPQHGTLSGVSSTGTSETGVVAYTPDESFDGSDSFEYVACDPFDRGPSGTSCSPVGDPGVVTIKTTLPTPSEIGLVSLHEDLVGDPVGANAIQLAATQPVDEKDEQLTFHIVEPAKHGDRSAIDSNGLVTYVPDEDFHGDAGSPYDDSFTWVACDGVPRTDNPHGCSASQTVTLKVESVNDLPVPDTDDVSAVEDAPREIQLRGHDVDGDPLTYSVVSQPERGTVTGDGSGLVEYKPRANFNGDDIFKYVVCDRPDSTTDPLHCAPERTVTIEVTPMNDLPAPDPANRAGDEDGGAISIELSATDVDGDKVTFELKQRTTKKGGAVALRDGSARYVPPTDFYGMDSFEFEACDDDGCSTATATITVTAINDAPVAKDATAKTGAGTAVVVELEASDVEGDSLTYDISGAPAHGAVTIDGGRARYEPAAGFSGSDSFRFRAADPSGEVGEATVTVEVAPPPPEPAKTTEPDSTTPSSNPPNHPSDTGKPSPTGPIAGSAAKVTGTVLVTLPGGRAKALEPGGKLPQAAIIDASAGTITIDVARTGSSAGPPQRLTAAQGSFVLKTVREEGKRVLVLRMHASTPAGTRARAASAQPAGTLRLVVSGRCSCRVVSRDAKVTPIRAARWTTVQTAKGTKVNVASGHVTVVDRIHPCPAHVVPQPLATSPSSDRSGYYVAYTPLKHKPVPGRSKQRPRC